MNISASIRRLSQVFIILFVALSGGLVYWQVVVAQQVASNAHNGRHCLSDAAPIRGRILDRNGVVLADSQPIDPNNPNGGLLCGYQRHYYLKDYPSLASLIGIYISPNYIETGIEKQYDDYLSGRVGLTQLGNTVNQVLHRPPTGDDIYLTIDTRIQKIAEHYFDADAPRANNPINLPIIDHVNVFPTNRGSVIITDPHTGDILAMVSRPTFDSNRVASGDLNYFNQVASDPQQPLIERPTTFRYVPGSTYKTMTLLAALDSGSSQLTDQFDKQQALGPVRLGNETFDKGNNLEPYTHTFPVSLEYGFVHSDNIIFAQTGVKMGVQTWLDYNQRFYVGKDIPFDLPVTKSSVMPPDGSTLSVAGLGENSFGQGVNFVTPLQMSLFNEAIANNGEMMRPTLITRVQGTDGTVIKSSTPQSLGTPISDQTASQMRDAMYGVVRCGSGSIVPKLYNSPWSIIAKTGTGEVGGGKGAEAWLLSQAPYRNPRLVITSMWENGGEGGYLNGPMVADMYNAIYSQVLKLPLPTPPDPQEPYCFNHQLLQ